MKEIAKWAGAIAWIVAAALVHLPLAPFWLLFTIIAASLGLCAWKEVPRLTLDYSTGFYLWGER